MNAVFIETSQFTRRVTSKLSDEVLAELQQRLMNDPEAGAVMPGCGGLRKIRLADPTRGKGKRGGWRAIYIYVPEVKQFLLIDLYEKNEQTDLSAAERRQLRELAEHFKSSIMSASLRRPTRPGQGS